MDTFLLSYLFLLTSGFTVGIQLSSSSDKATVGVDFTFTCVTTTNVLRFTRDLISECTITGGYPNGTCKFFGSYNTNYKYDCNTNSALYKLTIPSSFDIYTLHGTNWACSPAIDPGVSNIIQLNVNRIQLTSSSEKATVGVDFTFTCLTKINAISFHKELLNECTIIGGYPNGTCKFAGSFNTNYAYDCDTNTGVYKLTIPSSFDIDTLHGSNWTCLPAIDPGQSNTIQLYVSVPVTQVFITTVPTDRNQIQISSDENQKINCKTNAARPPSKIQWYISNRNITGSATSQADICNDGCNGKVISSSALTYSGKIADHGNILYCTATNTNGQSVKSENKSIVIWYAPNDTPSIQQIPPGGIVRGNEIRLICTLTGGNPLALLTWDCDGTISNETTGNIASYSVKFVANRTSNNKICTCSASHVVLSYKPSISHQLIVYHEPIYYPIINQTPSGHIMSGTHVILTCEILGGNPLAILSWNCTGVSRNNTSVNKASYSVEIVVNRTFNNRICACSATHYIPSFRPTVRHLLHVYFKPFLDNTKPSSSTNISVTENKILQITLAIHANPKPTIQWTFNADTGCNFSSLVSNTTTNGFLTSSSISIDKVKSSDFGEYTFTANNTVGIFFRRFEVIKEASSIQETCAHIQERTSIFVIGIVTLVVGLLSLTASVIFIVRHSFKNKTIKTSKKDEYTGVQKGNPAFTDEYTTIQSEIESRQPQEQSNNTYEECGRNFEPHAYETLDK